MEQKTNRLGESQVVDEGVSGRLEKISELKEALKEVRDMPQELSLLNALTQEIRALRQLLDVRI